MWLATQHGFYSIVRQAEDTYFVRARRRRDLENLCDLMAIDADIHIWPDANYRFRMIIDVESLLEMFVQLGTQIDYPNFKGRIYEREDQSHKLGAYQRIWELMAAIDGEG